MGQRVQGATRQQSHLVLRTIEPFPWLSWSDQPETRFLVIHRGSYYPSNQLHDWLFMKFLRDVCQIEGSWPVSRYKSATFAFKISPWTVGTGFLIEWPIITINFQHALFSMVSTHGPVSSCKVQELSFTIKTSTPSKLRNRPRMDKRDGWENGTTPDSSFQAGFREEGKDMQNIHTVETYETPEVIYVYVCVIVWCAVASS